MTLSQETRRIVVVLVSCAQSERYLRALFALLDGEERERAWRMRSTPRRTAFVVAHGWRRVLLSSVAESVSPESWRFAAGPWGRPLPLPEGTGCDASLSYSGDVIAIAVSQGCRVGVDIEISAEDWADPDFLDHWTSREAVAKCLGTGICGEVPETAPAISPPRPSPPCWQEVPQAGVILRRQWIELDRTRVALAIAAAVPCRSFPVKN